MFFDEWPKIPGAWNKVWKLQVPSKVRSFLWRACKDCLPTRLKFQSRGIMVQLSCIMYGNSIENAWHIFVTCLFAQNCWSYAKLIPIINSCSNNVIDWVFNVIVVMKDEGLDKFSMILWNILRQHNEKLWNNSSMDEAQTVRSAIEFYLNDWLAVKQ